MLARLIIVGGLLMAALTAASAKDKPTYYTPERIAIGQANMANQPWGKSTLDRIMKGDANNYYIGRDYGEAAECIKQTDDFIWLMQPTTKIPRVPPNHETNALCPIHGEKVRESSAWTAWTTDPVHHPYKVRCRVGGEWYPSNDYMNGDMTSGEFPDDGNGCVYQGKTYHFLKEYAHMAYGNNTVPCLRSLSQAWLLTGDKQYARKGCILLARLASEYPNFTDRKDRLFYGPYNGRDPHYTWKTGGMITDLIWETFCLESEAYAYDGLYNYMDQDPDMIAFLKSKGLPVENGNDLRRYIEDNLLRVGMQGILNGYIHGNEGFHQAAAMACALVLDDYSERHPNSKDMVDYAFLGEGHSAYMIANGTYRDGAGAESPGYNSIKFDFIRVNRLMEEIRKLHPDLFPTDRYPDLFGGAKGQALFDHFMDISVLSTFLPSIGDACGIAAPERNKPGMWSYIGAPNLYGFERFHEPRLAKACTARDGSLAIGDLFEYYPEAELKAALTSPESEIKYRSRLLDGYGVAILETGPAATGHATSINYASIPGHRQYDNLNIEVFARGLNILPDLGYPFTWDYREWDSGTMSHNTVSVDQTTAAYNIGGQANLMVSENGVHVFSGRHDPYPEGAATPVKGKPAQGVTRYERTTVMVDVDKDRFYVVDLFAVNGGEYQDQTWHGPLTPVQAPALNWVEQPTGTLAGPDVAHGAPYTDKWGRKDVGFPCYLSKIKRAELTAPAVWSWDYGLPEGDKLNLHILPVGGPAEIIMGTGRSPVRPANWGLDYILVRKPSKGAAITYYVTVLDPYQSTPTVQKARVISEWPLVVEVTRPDGADRITFSIVGGPSRTTAHRPLGVKFEGRAGGKLARQVEVGELGPQQGPGYATATVEAVDYAANRLGINCPADQDSDFVVDRYLRVYNWGRSAMYRILAAKREGGLLWLSLDSTPGIGQGPVASIRDDALVLGDELVFSNNSTDDQGHLKQANDYYAGCWLGEGAAARQLQGAAGSTLFFKAPATKAELEKQFGGKIINLWQYGIGDSVEIVRVK